MQRLGKLLHSIDGKGYPAYKDIKGQYTFDGYTVSVDHVQGDPFAAPSRISLRVPQEQAAIPHILWQMPNHNTIRKIALEDFLARKTQQAIRATAKGHRGSGCSGLIAIETSGQQILQRNAIIVTDEYIEVRIVMGLPANGRRVAGLQAHDMFFKELPLIVNKALNYRNLDASSIKRHLDCAEDQDSLRNALATHELVAFIANGAILPRRSGIDDSPLSQNALSFRAADSLSVTLEVPHAGRVTGMGIPKGVTLIVGGGFHGKSTLLHAIERGPYNHIPGDGREQVVTDASAVKVRAEDGRSIARVNISPFIDRLPFNRDTHSFSTENASGSTSQAANIIEALECGARVLLIDEDTSATNFMIRDERMQALVAQDKEPITPLVARVRELYQQHGISTVIVMGGSGDYFDIADTVIMMDCYEPIDVTAKARALSRTPADRSQAAVGVPADASENRTRLPPFCISSRRKPGADVLDASRKNRESKIDTRDLRTIHYGEHKIDLSLVEQLIDMGQTRAIGLMIQYYAQRYAAQTGSLIEGLDKVMQDIAQQGLDTISTYKVGNLALPRKHELAAAINRIREGKWRD